MRKININIYIRKGMISMREFKNALQYGKKGEKMVYDYFSEKENYEIIDVSNDKDYQKSDIDFLLINTKDGRQRSLEVKNANDTLKKYGTLAVEDTYILKSTMKRQNGWLWESDATHFIFTLPDEKEFYIIKSADLRSYIFDQNYRKTQLSKKIDEECESEEDSVFLDDYVYDDHHCYKKTWVYYINLDDLKEKRRVIKIKLK